ncbi:hypothetical protein KTJ16_00280 [Acinetobacter bereziniae]|uniref:hypothetical protein n=1 Tax=Acinetobacter bereziniae TaxID=106648 RepID=UPI0021CDD6CB|nr:hypothetical protein [Acinetobacter bereziniae]MCU4539616.1 hypothetical protein [Acinetobacter bereziniae]MCU4624205.1 hypothetical protein [Acinetobacter bereziniae]
MLQINLGHVAVFIFIILPFAIVMGAIFTMAIAHVSALKKQADCLKEKSIEENNNAPIY